jgi:hypothetical protein
MQIELSGAQAGLAIHGLPISLNFTTSARVRGVFSMETLQTALKRLRVIHPLLAVRLDPGANGGKPCFNSEDVPPIPVRVVERRSDQDWVREVEREIAIPSNYRTGPLFRVVWVRGETVSDLVLVSDHITADGLAGIYALRDLLRLLADPDIEIDPYTPVRYAEAVPPAMRRMILEKTSAEATGFPDLPEGAWGEGPFPLLKVIPIELSKAETTALVTRCKAEGTTVQAALCAAFAAPFGERQPEKPVRWVETPYNLRNRMTRPLENTYGVFISLVYSKVDCTPGKDRWEAAREVGKSLTRVPDEQLFSIPIVMLHVAEHPLSVPVVGFDYDLSISNLGRVNIPEQYGDLTLETIYAPTMNISGPTHRILGVTTFGGRMRCTFTSRDPAAPELVRRSLEILASMTA